MFDKAWQILLVDDEPDVLSVSRLAMQNFEVYGLPLSIHTASSKAEALEWLQSEPGQVPALAVAFIDVVMENDNAGLELCQFIRGEMRNKTTQLFIRTGQPGIAPERAVIDGYDINGYFTKAEATEDKLYSLVKSGVRQALWSRVSMVTVRILGMIIANASSRERIAQALHQFFTGAPGRNVQVQGGFIVGDRFIGSSMNEQSAIALRDRLTQLEGRPLGSDEDKCVRDEKNLLIRVAPQPAKAEVCLLVQTTFELPDEIVFMMHQALTGLATIWQQAK